MEGTYGDVMLDSNIFKKNMRKMSAAPAMMEGQLIKRQQWNPYSAEGGSTAAIAGEDFIVAVSDTRMSQFEVNILTRKAEKLHVLSDNVVLATTGFYGDVLQLKRVLQARLHKYKFDYRHEMPVDFCAEMLSRNLYYKRFFPYYTGAILCGIDESGKGAVYGFDPVGCIERIKYACTGSASHLIEPFIDNQAEFNNLDEGMERLELNVDRAVALMKDVFRFSTERETNTGDSLFIVVAEAGKPIKSFTVPLRED